MAYRCFLQCDLYQQKTGNHLNPWRDWLKKLYLHTMEYSTATQQNEIAVCVLTQHTYGDKILMKKARYRVGCLANNLLCKKKICTYTNTYTCYVYTHTHVHWKGCTSGRMQWKLAACRRRTLPGWRAGGVLTFPGPTFSTLQISYYEYYQLIS